MEKTLNIFVINLQACLLLIWPMASHTILSWRQKYAATTAPGLIRNNPGHTTHISLYPGVRQNLSEITHFCS